MADKEQKKTDKALSGGVAWSEDEESAHLPEKLELLESISPQALADTKKLVKAALDKMLTIKQIWAEAKRIIEKYAESEETIIGLILIMFDRNQHLKADTVTIFVDLEKWTNKEENPFGLRKDQQQIPHGSWIIGYCIRNCVASWQIPRCFSNKDQRAHLLEALESALLYLDAQEYPLLQPTVEKHFSKKKFIRISDYNR
jgi:hypothetical protein